MIDVKQDQMSRTFDASAHMLDVQSLTSSSETDSRCDFLGTKIRPSVVRTTAATTVYTVFFSGECNALYNESEVCTRH